MRRRKGSKATHLLLAGGGGREATFLSVGGGWVARQCTFCSQREGREATYPSVGRGSAVIEADHTYSASLLSIHGLLCR